MMLTGTVMLSQLPHQQQPQAFNQPSIASNSSSSSSNGTNNIISSTASHFTSSQLSNMNPNHEKSHVVTNEHMQNGYFHDAQPSPRQQVQINSISHIISQGTNGANAKYYHNHTQLVNGSGSIHEDLVIDTNTNGSGYRNGVLKSASQTNQMYQRTNNTYSHESNTQQHNWQQSAHSFDHDMGVKPSNQTSNMLNGSKYRPINGSETTYSTNSLASSSNHLVKNYKLSSSNTNNLLNDTRKQHGQEATSNTPPMSSSLHSTNLKVATYFDSTEQKALANGSIYERVKRRDGQGFQNSNSRDGSRPLSKEPGPDDGGNFDDMKKIEVQILPQDDNWGENTTAMTADLSDINDDMTEDGRSIRFPLNPPLNNKFDQNGSARSFFSWIRHAVAKKLSFIFKALIITSSFITPILFLALPYWKLLFPDWQINDCGLECEGLLIGIAFRLLFLFFTFFVMFKIQMGRDNELPRVYELKALLIFVIFIMTFSFWLFYSVRIINTYLADYYKILQFTASYIELLWYLLIISVFALKLRHLRPSYVVRVMRSPDGQQSQFDIGTMSIQRAALFILENYYRDFNVYNPWLDSAQRKRNTQLLQLEQISCKKKAIGSGANILKQTSEGEASEGDIVVDNCETESVYNNKRGSLSRRSANGKSADVQSITNILGTNLSANDRLYKEYEYERRLKKRKARLIMTTEEAFNSIRRVATEMLETSENSANNPPPTGMDPFEAAQALFAAIARDLRRYLRLTRQQPYFTREQIVSHLANCIAYDMSPKSFLQKFIEGESLLFNDRALVNQYNQHTFFEHQQELFLKRQEQQRLGQPIYMGNNYTTCFETLEQTWILISDNPLYQNIENNLMIVLKQNDVTLMCTFKRLPRFKLIEDILDPKRNKFMLKLNSETTV